MFEAISLKMCHSFKSKDSAQQYPTRMSKFVLELGTQTFVQNYRIILLKKIVRKNETQMVLPTEYNHDTFVSLVMLLMTPI